MTPQKDNGIAQDRYFSKRLATLIFQGIFFVRGNEEDKITEMSMTLKA